MLQPFYPPCLIQVRCLYSLHYFPFACGYLYPGERHPFWEMVYVDQGSADIGADGQMCRLTQGQAIFHRPGEFHTIWANSKLGANLFVVSFGCDSPAMDAFVRKVCLLDESQRKLVSRMVREGQRAFDHLLDVPLAQGLSAAQHAPPGSSQMIVLLLTQLLLELLLPEESKPAARVVLTDDTDFAFVMQRIVAQMNAHLNGTLRFESICREAGLSGTALKERFKRYTGTTVIAYYQRMRIQESRRLLRQGRMSVSRVASELGYSSPQAFSRQFKHIMGVSPAKYLTMIKN